MIPDQTQNVTEDQILDVQESHGEFMKIENELREIRDIRDAFSNNGTITSPGLPLSTSTHSPSSRYRSSIIVGKTSANSRRKQWKKRPMSLDAILMKDKTGNKPILPAPSVPAIGSNDYW